MTLPICIEFKQAKQIAMPTDKKVPACSKNISRVPKPWYLI